MCSIIAKMLASYFNSLTQMCYVLKYAETCYFHSCSVLRYILFEKNYGDHPRSMIAFDPLAV